MATAKKTKPDKFLGHGLYTVAEAAMYCGVSTALMSRWLFGTSNSRRVIDPEFGPEDRHVSFLDLIQTLAIREIRRQHEVPLEKFREAIAFAKKQGFDHPFARQHRTFLYGGELVIRRSNEEDYVEASGKHPGQGMLPFVELYLQELKFNEDGLADRYRIFRSHHEQPVPVTMDPAVRFGEPLLPSGYTAWAIRDSVIAEGGFDRAAAAYGIPVEEVETAYRFVDGLGKKAA